MSRIRGEELPGFAEVLQNWLLHQPWFSVPAGRRTLTRVGGLRLPAPQGDPDPRVLVELHLIEVEHREGVERISVPVALRSRPSAHAGKSALIGKLGTAETGEHWLYDGARDRAFLAAWLEMARRGQGSRNGRSKGEAFAGFQEHAPFTAALRREQLESVEENVTRTLVTPEDAPADAGLEHQVVVEILRRPKAERAEHLETALALTKVNSGNIAKVLGLVAGAWEDRAAVDPEDPETVLWDAGDLGVIREARGAGVSGWSAAHDALLAGESFEQQARTLGRTLGDLHADLAAAFGAHPQTAEQLRTMARNSQEALSEQWEYVRHSFDEDEAADLSEVVDMLKLQLRDADEPLMLQQIHGDLGLEDARGFGSAEQWVIDERRGMVDHALPLRDVVTLLMSFANLVMEAASADAERSDEEQPREPINFGKWYEDISRFVLEGYRSSDADSAGVDSVFFHAAMMVEAMELFSQWKGQWVFRPSMLLQVEP